LITECAIVASAVYP
jgi:cyclopropane fatty-acyl-phospholipid synthase-like methyltransferase